MSTRALQKALDDLEFQVADITDKARAAEEVAAAREELEAIRKACRDYSEGTEYGEAVTSGASDAVELFRSISQEKSK